MSSFPTGSFQLPFGVRTLSPYPVDYWSGPFTGDSYSVAAAAANSAIPSGVRFISMGVRLIVDDVPKIYWYSGGTADNNLVEFIGEVGSGYQGFQGFQGNIGITGTQGFQGFQGRQGFQGNIGITGTQGFQGFQGNIGITGTQGFQGRQGFQGPKGSGKYYYGPTAPESTDDGLTLGSKWFNTEVGAEFTYIVEGDDITQWVMVNVFSATGPQGPTGSGSGEGSGAQGFQGFQGPPGSGEGSGSQGFQGFQGNIGITGTQGFQGFQGNIGITGTQGFQGFQGLIGITGTQGFQGFQGPAGEGDGFTFSSDLPVNIAVGKSFGKYLRGDTIPALGKTIPEVLNLALNENIPPTVTLSRSLASISFNDISPQIQLTFGYVINSPGATGASASLEYRLGAGSWASLTSGTLGLTSFEGTFNHTPSLPEFNTSNLNYRYTVEDSAIPPETGVASISVTQTQHANPSVTISIIGTNISSYENNYSRERGNTESQISATITRVSPNVDLSSWGYQYRTSANTTYTNILTGQAASNVISFTTPIQTHTGPTSGISWIQYQFIVADEYETNTYESNRINLYYLAFYGPTANPPTNSTEVRSAPLRKLTSNLSNPFTFDSGITENDFVIALPTNIQISEVKDQQNVDLTTNFTNGYTAFDVNNYSGYPKSYNIYTYSPTLPYNPQVTFTVTTSGTVS